MPPSQPSLGVSLIPHWSWCPQFLHSQIPAPQSQLDPGAPFPPSEAVPVSPWSTPIPTWFCLSHSPPPSPDLLFPLPSYLLEVVKGCQDDLMAAPHQADSRQQLQHQRLHPGHSITISTSITPSQLQEPCPTLPDPPLPRVLVIEAQGDLIDSMWVRHDQVEAILWGWRSNCQLWWQW